MGFGPVARCILPVDRCALSVVGRSRAIILGEQDATVATALPVWGRQSRSRRLTAFPGNGTTIATGLLARQVPVSAACDIPTVVDRFVCRELVLVRALLVARAGDLVAVGSGLVAVGSGLVAIAGLLSSARLEILVVRVHVTSFGASVTKLGGPVAVLRRPISIGRRGTHRRRPLCIIVLRHGLIPRV